MAEYKYTQMILDILREAELNMCRVWIRPNTILQVEYMGGDEYRWSLPGNARGYINRESIEAQLAERADRTVVERPLKKGTAKNCISQLHELMCGALNRATDRSREWFIREIDIDLAQDIYARKTFLEKKYLWG